MSAKSPRDSKTTAITANLIKIKAFDHSGLQSISQSLIHKDKEIICSRAKS